MVTKPRATARLGYSVTLLIIFALLGYVAATEDLTAVVINSKNSERNIRITDDNAEDRAIDAKISGVAKLVEALKSKSPFVDGLLSKIKAHTPVSNLLESQQFNTLSSHILGMYRGKKADKVMIAMLATKYDDEALTAILREARGRGQTKDLADRLSKARLSNWFHEGVTADAAFLKLNLPASKGMLVWFPETRLWLSYVSKLHPQNVDDEILSVLKTHYKTDEQLGRVLQYGLLTNAYITARLKKIVFKYWLREQKSVENIFEFLLKRHKNLVFQTRHLGDWASYVHMVDKETPIATMISVLNKKFTNYLPNMLKQARVKRPKTPAEQYAKDLAAKLEIERWFSNRWSADAVFYKLELDSAGSRVLQMPVFGTWTSYAQRLEGSGAVKVMLKTLLEQYSKPKLFGLLGAAKKVEATKTIATQLQNKLLTSLFTGLKA